MNSTHGRERRADTRGINQPKESPPRTHKEPAARGKKLALTFGTLLSSQGADAHRTDPHGLRRRLVVLLYVATGWAPSGAPPAGLSTRAAQRESYAGAAGGGKPVG